MPQSFATRAIKTLADAVAPPLCPLSGERVAVHGSIGFEAWSKIHWLDAPVCSVCGIPSSSSSDADHNLICGSCLAFPTGLDAARSAVAYDDASKGLILSFKHGDRTDLAPMLANWLLRVGSSFLVATTDAVDPVVVPVPLHWKRLLGRRYNQAALLAKSVARAAVVRCEPDVLKRIKPTVPQKNLSAEARRRNLQGAIVVSKPDIVQGADVVLIDDVYTTGATLSACAKVLKRAGAQSVKALTVARVVKGGPLTL
ncbi:MAG: ComF family protein [Pseudomonadota bacterium]